MGVAIGYLDGPRLRRSLLAATQWVGAGREELNRINVFPVPDGDTGTNFWLTMRSIADALRRLGDAPLPEVSRAAAQAAVMGSRGNSGMMLSHFLLGFDEGIGARFRIRARELAGAIRSGSERLQSALENPVEGTILTVCREAAVGAEQAAEAGHDVGGVVRATLSYAEQALKRVLGLLDEALPSRPERLRMGVVHADVPEVAEEVREALAGRYHPYEIVVSPLTAVLAAHTGPGAWGVIWQVEDGAPARQGNKTAGGAL